MQQTIHVPSEIHFALGRVWHLRHCFMCWKVPFCSSSSDCAIWSICQMQQYLIVALLSCLKICGVSLILQNSFKNIWWTKTTWVMLLNPLQTRSKGKKKNKTGRNFLGRLQALWHVKGLFTLKAMLRAKFLSLEQQANFVVIIDVLCWVQLELLGEWDVVVLLLSLSIFRGWWWSWRVIQQLPLP